MSEPPLVLTVEEAARLLRIGRTAAYEAVRRGDIPSLRIGKTLRVPRVALERMLAGEGAEQAAPAGGLRLVEGGRS